MNDWLAHSRVMRPGFSRWVFGVAAVGWLACAAPPSGWDVDDLEDRHPSVEAVDGHRLEETLPYFALGEDGFALFLCRWSNAAPVPVWLPPNASPDQRAVLEQAVAAWQGAGLGISFEVGTWQGAPPLAGIVVEIVDPSARAIATAADTIADCAIPQEVVKPSEDAPALPVDAELQYASIHLTVERPDLLGRPVPLSRSELLGATLHELGHALGFAGHVKRGESVMSAHGQMDAVRRWGERIEAGEPLSAPSVLALYAAPSGARVGWLSLQRRQLDPIREVSGIATGLGLRGPYSRVGEASSRMLWRDDRGSSVGVVILDWPRALHEPATLEPRPNRRARVLVEQTGR